MANLYLLFNHELSEMQVTNAHNVLKVNKIVDLKPLTGAVWSAVPSGEMFPRKELDKVIEVLQNETKTGDFVLIMGEWGAVFYTVDWCFQNGRIPCHTTTSRKILEEISSGPQEIEVTRRISHDSFRLYVRFERSLNG